MKPDLTEAHLRQLLDERAEDETVEFKREFRLVGRYADPAQVKTVAAMMVYGGYIVFGVQESPFRIKGLGKQQHNFDEQRIRASLRRWLKPPFRVRTATHEIDGVTVGFLYIAPRLYGHASFHAAGLAPAGKLEFEPGDVFIRDGTSNRPATGRALKAIRAARRQTIARHWLARTATVTLIALSLGTLAAAISRPGDSPLESPDERLAKARANIIANARQAGFRLRHEQHAELRGPGLPPSRVMVFRSFKPGTDQVGVDTTGAPRSDELRIYDQGTDGSLEEHFAFRPDPVVGFDDHLTAVAINDDPARDYDRDSDADLVGAFGFEEDERGRGSGRPFRVGWDDRSSRYRLEALPGPQFDVIVIKLKRDVRVLGRRVPKGDKQFQKFEPPVELRDSARGIGGKFPGVVAYALRRSNRYGLLLLIANTGKRERFDREVHYDVSAWQVDLGRFPARGTPCIAAVSRKHDIDIHTANPLTTDIESKLKEFAHSTYCG